MKKKSPNQYEQELKAGARRFAIELRRKDIKYDTSKAATFNKSFGGRRIVAPNIISIYSFAENADYFSDTVRFIENIKKYFRREKCVIDFRNTTQVSAAALVVVYAAFDNARNNGNESASISWAIKSPEVNRAIKRTNLAGLIQNVKFDYRFESKDDLPIVAGSSSLYMEEIVDHIQNRIFDNQMPPETEHVFGDAVSETINNVNLHAYPGREAEQKNWWLMCSLYGNVLYLAIYDTGVGIPKTVLDKPWLLTSMKKSYPKVYEELLTLYPDLEKTGLIPFVFIPKVNDPTLIHLSMQGDVSGTKKSKHGQGSKSIKKLVSDTSEGKLWVFSNKGVYIFENEDMEPKTFKLPKHLPGTLVQWNIKIA